MFGVAIFAIVSIGPCPVVEVQKISDVAEMIIASHLEHIEYVEGIGGEAIKCRVGCAGRLIEMVLHDHVERDFLQQLLAECAHVRDIPISKLAPVLGSGRVQVS